MSFYNMETPEVTAANLSDLDELLNRDEVTYGEVSRALAIFKTTDGSIQVELKL